MPEELQDFSKLYTKEDFVFKEGVKKADPDKPITMGRDAAGNYVVQDGNHRAVKAFQENKPLKYDKVATFKGDVSQDLYYNHISQVKVK